MGIWLRIGVSTWLAVVSVVDLRARRIPNALVLPESYPRIVALQPPMRPKSDFVSGNLSVSYPRIVALQPAPLPIAHFAQLSFSILSSDRGIATKRHVCRAKRNPGTFSILSSDRGIAAGAISL